MQSQTLNQRGGGEEGRGHGTGEQPEREG